MDRNVRPPADPHVAHKSLSARRAWIEIVVSLALDQYLKVALRKESVDRNRIPYWFKVTEAGRSPQGERG